MSIEDEIKESLENKDLSRFKEIISRPKAYINDILRNGVLHHILEYNKDIPIEFIKALLEQETINVNKLHSESGFPALLCTDREDIQDVLLENPNYNVNRLVNDKNVMFWVIQNNKLELLKKLIENPHIDLLDSNETDESKITVIQSMGTPEIFKLFLESPKMNLDGVGWSEMTIPLSASLKNKWYESSLLLLEKGADMNIGIENSDITIAEYIIASGNVVLINFVLEHLDDVKSKDRLLPIVLSEKSTNFSYSSMERDINLIGRLIQKKCLISKETLSNILGSIDVLIRLIELLDEEINIKDKKLLISSVLLLNNVEAIDKLIKTKFAVSNKNIILETLYGIENPLIVESILGSDELVKDDVAAILTNNSNSVCVTLIKMGESGIERINHLLDLKDVILPTTFRPLNILLDSGVLSQIKLAKRLIEKHGVYVQSVDTMNSLIDNKRTDILEIIIRKESRLNTLHKTLTPKSFIQLVSEIGENIELLTLLISRITTEKGKLLIIEGIRDVIDTFPELVLRVIKTSESDVYMGLLTDLLENLPTEEYKREFMSFLKANNPSIIEKIRKMNLLEHFIQDDRLDIVRLIMDNNELIGTVNIPMLIDVYPDFMLQNIREMFDKIPSQKISLFGAVPGVINQIQDFGVHIFSNNVLETIVKHPMYNPNEIYNDFDGNTYTQLQLLLEAIENAPSEKMKTDLVGVFIDILDHKKTDVNQLNGKEGHIETQTILDRLLRHYIDEYEDKEYGLDKPFHILLKMLLEDPRLNMTPHVHFHQIVCEKRMGDLFTHMISRPEFDIDVSAILHILCFLGNDVFLNVLLTLEKFDINYKDDNKTGLHVCIEYEKYDCAKLLIEDPRIDLSIIKDGKNYAEFAIENNMIRLIEIFKSRGIKDDRHERMEQEAIEYNNRMAEMGRVKQGRLREVLDIYDAILKERENPDSLQNSNITLFSKTLCPFCLVPLEKEDPRECVYLSGHICAPEIRNEALMAKYLGPAWKTAHFEVCCTCGRPGKNHGHYRLVPDGETSSLAAPGALVNHWRCDQYNGGGGKEEMVTRLVGILSYLKTRIDSEEHLEDNAELSRQLAIEADKALFDDSMKQRAMLIFERKAWNANSTIAPYKRFNAPKVVLAAARDEEVREPIAYFDNREVEDKLSCGICLEERDDMYRPHISDTSYICGVCLYRTVCTSDYNTVTCELGCKPKKQIYKVSVQALMDSRLCELMAPIAAEEDAQARRNENARRAQADRNNDLEDGEIRE